MTTESPWTEVRLGDIGQSLIGLTYSPENVKRSGTLVLRSSNIQDGNLALDDNVYVDCAIPQKIRVRENDILICVRNGSRRLIGKSVILDQRVIGQTFGAFMAVYRSDVNSFLQYFFQSYDFKRQIDEHLGATINQITNRSLNSFVVALPPKPEQIAITSRLKDEDGVISGLQRLIAKKQAVKQGVMQQLVTGRTRLPGFTKTWQQALLSDVAIIDPEALPASTDARALIDYISLEDVERGQILAHSHLRFGSAPSRARRVIKSGDVLFGTVRPNLKSHAIYRAGLQRPIASTGFAVVRAVRERTDAQFLFHLLMSRLTDVQVERIIAGSNYPAVSSRDIRRLAFNFPPIEEQRAIGSMLADIDDDIARITQRLVKAQAIKVGMMQQLLTGRTRLPLKGIAQ